MFHRSALSFVLLSWALFVVDPVAASPPGNGSQTLYPLVDNLGLAVRAGTQERPGVVLGDHHVLIAVRERLQGGTDLNGDGDLDDRVAHLYDARDGSITNLRLALVEGIETPFEALGDIGVFYVSESNNGGSDLNRDGDGLDVVAHVLTASNPVLTPIPLDVRSLPGNISRDSVYFLGEESSNGDANGDGDTRDVTLYEHPVRGDTRSLGISVSSSDLSVGRDFCAFRVLEREERRDLNGDGDTFDAIVHSYDARSQRIRSLGVSSSFVLLEDRIALNTSEVEVGTDLNGDGDTSDMAVQIYDPRTGELENLGIAGFSLVGSGRVLSFLVWEVGQGHTDLDGNGSVGGFVPHVYRTDDQSLVNLARRFTAVSPFPVSHGRFVTYTTGPLGAYEAWAYDSVTGTSTALGRVIGNFTRAAGEVLVYEEVEVADLNGDGDLDDRVLRTLDPRTSTISPPLLTSNLASSRPAKRIVAAAPGVVFASALESADGGCDLNGDGDSLDRVAHVVNLQTGDRFNLGLAAEFGPGVQGSLVVFSVLEADQGGMDLNGDGDIQDRVVHVALLDQGTRLGTVNAGVGPIADVLLLNGSPGDGPERRVGFGVSDPFELSMLAPPTLPAGRVAPFAVYAWPGNPSLRDARRLPLGLGWMAAPHFLVGGSGQPRVIWNNAGHRAQLGFPDRPSKPAPSSFFRRPNGLGREDRFFLQGIILDPGSAGLFHASLTNGIFAVPILGE